MASLLIVDGDRNFREALAIALRLDGLAVAAAETVEAALSWITGAAFDLCVIDAHLAGSEGLLEQARRAGLRVVVTGPYPELLDGVVRRHPRAEVLAKPFPPAELVARVS